MVRAAPKPKTEGTDPLKPKTEKAKVDKPKSDKPKVVKPKAPKAEKAPKASASKEEKAGEEKEKVKPVTGDEAAALILEYLKVQNRPFSATEISANLHGKVTKTVADKLLKDMEVNGTIMMKATNPNDPTKKGTQFVFWAIQVPTDTASPEELASMEDEIASLRAHLPSLKIASKHANTKLQALFAAPTTADLAVMVEALRASNAEKLARLQAFQASGVQAISAEEKQVVEKEHAYWRARAAARKNAFFGIVGALSEGMSLEDIWDAAGLELEA